MTRGRCARDGAPSHDRGSAPRTKEQPCPHPHDPGQATAAAVAVALVPSVAAVADAGRRRPRRAAPARPGRAAGGDLRRRPRVRRVLRRRPATAARDQAASSSRSPSQPVEGFSAIVDGRRHGEYLAMADNGFGTKANSLDFLIRAYYVEPDFKTAARRHPARSPSATTSSSAIPDGADRVPDRQRGHARAAADRRRHRPRVDAARPQRRPVGRRRVRPVDPALRRRRRAARGADRAARRPACRRTTRASAAQPATPAQQPGHRGDGDHAERPVPLRRARGRRSSPTPTERAGGSTSTTSATRPFTGTSGTYHVETPTSTFVADAQALDRHRLLVIERDGGRGLTAQFRTVYEVDLREVDADGTLAKTRGRRPRRDPRPRPRLAAADPRPATSASAIRSG